MEGPELKVSEDEEDEEEEEEQAEDASFSVTKGNPSIMLIVFEIVYTVRGFRR